eukprot:gnl/TRDRNA2_/TRDRNA2_137866_c2_seq2.p2 gnl/TRDRNA2_/TRDRNA2_137866_c2~~gnl/TRDRNA2_/TRDRNA2_137866_c2_seq2.p2  ORF type:complete len:284 (+),score=33.99 gnl/TRDRNA2_/TRDRNA2_137866_c2_seq2:372-1223(+)
MRALLERLRSNMNMPKNWDVMQGQVLPPAGWACTTTFKEVQHARVLDTLQRLLDSTRMYVRTKDRRGFPPRRLVLQSALHIQNPSAYLSYQHRRHVQFEQLNFKTFRCVLGPKTKTFSRELAAIHRGKSYILDHSKNEFHLFHGTSHASAKAISKNNFDMRLAGMAAGTRFGKGLYFACNCTKSDEYAKCEHNDAGCSCGGVRPLLLCRVLLGRCHYVDCEPAPAPAELERACGVGRSSVPESTRCDSVFADREKAVGTFKEFVVFNTDQVYPEYVLWYTREF